MSLPSEFAKYQVPEGAMIRMSTRGCAPKSDEERTEVCDRALEEACAADPGLKAFWAYVDAMPEDTEEERGNKVGLCTDLMVAVGLMEVRGT